MDGQKPRQGLASTISKGLQRLSSRQKSNEPVVAKDPGFLRPQFSQKRPSLDAKALEEAHRQALEKRESLKDEGIKSLPEGFFEEDFDPVLHELQKLQPGFELSELDEMAEGRANVLEFVNERLSKHVLANYDMFLKGINEAASVETDLQAAISLVRSSRRVLATSQTEVNSHLAIAMQQKHRMALAGMSETLHKLQQAFNTLNKLKTAQEEADYTTSFYLCAQCCQAVEKLESVAAANELLKTVNKLYEDSVRLLQNALANVCSDFDEEQYCKALEAYTFLGNTAALGEDVNSAFVNVINTSTMKVVRGIVLTRQGSQERVRKTTILQELLKWLPADLYRQCLSKGLMVIFDILVSHHRMTLWHESATQVHISKISQLKEEVDLLGLQNGISDADALSGSGKQTSIQSEKVHQSDTEAEGQGKDAILGSETAVENAAGQREEPTEAAVEVESLASGSNVLQAPNGTETVELRRFEEAAEAEADFSKAISNLSSSDQLAKLNSHDENSISGLKGTLPKLHARKSSRSASATLLQEPESAIVSEMSARLLPSRDTAERDSLQLPEALVQARQEHEAEVIWGETLLRVSEALTSGRRWVWDEAGRKVSLLLSAPAAFQGEHFLQVLEWTQTIVNVGESFSGSESTHLRDAMQRHSGKFFQAYHAANFQALQQMLEQEVWTPLPTPPGRVPDFKASLTGNSKANDAGTASHASFAEWVAAGNPWKKQDSDSARASAEDIDDKQEEQSAGSEISGGKVTDSPVEEEAGPQAEARPLDYPLAASTAQQNGRQPSGLMRLLPTDASRIYSGCCQLFELYFLHIFHCYSEVPIMELFRKEGPQQVAVDTLPVRLRTSVLRILTRSMPRLRAKYLPQPSKQASQQSMEHGKGQGANGLQRAHTQSLEPASSLKALSHPGNMFGLKERKVAVDSLELVAQQLQAALPSLSRLIGSSIDVPDFYNLDSFSQTLKASQDMKDVILRAGARLNLPLSWLPERLSEQNFNLEEPPTKSSPWVGVLLNHVKMFWQRLVTIGSMSHADCDQLWQYGLQYTAEMVLEGFARAGVRGKCTVMGRSAMSLDLQGLQRGLQSISSLRNASETIASSLRLVDAYIKAYYLPWGDELHKWAMTHPEYTQAQIMMLVNCLAESQGIKRRDRAMLIGQIEADLRELR